MKQALSQVAADYGMLFVLLVLCVVFSFATVKPYHPTGAEGGRQVADEVQSRYGDAIRVLVVGTKSPDDVAFAAAVGEEFGRAGVEVVDTLNGSPLDARRALDRVVADGEQLHVVACTNTAADWTLLSDLGVKIPELAGTKIVAPQSYLWPTFLKRDNLSNVAAQSAIFAIMAIGMTLVIITAGIDLSVGSLVALSAVAAAMFIRDLFGGFEAGPVGMTLSCLAAIGVAGLVGLFTGSMVTAFGIPPFIVTLAMMLIARGMAKILAEGQSIYQVPESFGWFAKGRALGVPNAVIVMLALYVVAHIVMTRTILGRYIYAVGGNREAARLSGVPVNRVLLFAYTLCGALAGLAGTIEASKLTSGSPLYGNMYELYVIAAVVVGGTSLAGGEGRVLNSLIGALIIAVIRNGMNLMKIESYTQDVVMGALILAAVLIDVLKKRGWRIGGT